MKANQTPFKCPKCGYKDSKFHKVCPECGRPFVRDFIDTQVHPRDPDPTGIYSGKFWARIFLVCTLIGLALYLLASSGSIQELLFLNGRYTSNIKNQQPTLIQGWLPPMKTLIVYTSVHHQNTEKVAKVMAEELEADLIPTMKAQPETLAAYDLIGFGSGIYFMKHHKTLLQFVETLQHMTQKRAFVFSTSGDGKIHHALLKEKLVNRGFAIVDEFCCKGWDTVGPLKLFGGINKGRPDENDLATARAFAQGLKNKL